MSFIYSYCLIIWMRLLFCWMAVVIICSCLVMFLKSLFLIREYKLYKVMGFIVMSQADLWFFLKLWCLKKGHCSLSKTRDTLSKSSNSLEPRTLQGAGTSSWELNTCWQKELWLSVSGPLCLQSVLHLRYPVFLLCNIAWLASCWLRSFVW